MMADLTSTVHRQYHAGEKWRATPIKFKKSKIDYSVFLGLVHPDAALNQEYLDAGAAKDRERPLCFGVHSGIACRRPARRERRYCWKGNK
jgi:hypothetical protein